MKILPMGIALVCALAFAAGATDELIMPHDVHFDSDVECESCHEGVSESTRAAESHRPDMDLCADCHEVDDDEGCTQCHTEPDDAESLDPAPFGADLFSHAAHGAAGMDCAACHGDPALETPLLPGKPECRECHETDDAYDDCRLCHSAGRGFLPADHDAGWTGGHGLAARLDRNACSLCHTENSCQECHGGDNLRPRTHGLDFTYTHAGAARAREQDCAVCHQEPRYCTGCHRAERVLPRDHARVDWVRLGDGGRHAEEGRFDLESCIACHDDGAAAPTCAACHGG